MAKAVSEIDIARPVASVFNYVADPRNLPKWHTETRAVRAEAKLPLTVGTAFQQLARLLFSFHWYTFEVTAYERNRLFEATVRSKFLRYRESFSFVSEGEHATRVTATVEYQLRGPLGLLRPIVALGAPSQYGGSLTALKDYLEAAPADVSERRAMLEARLHGLQRRVSRLSTFRGLSFLGVVVLAVVALALWLIERRDVDFLYVMMASYAVMFFLFPFLMPRQALELEMRSVQDQIALTRAEISEDERHAQQLFQAHQGELERYYVQARRQASWIFAVGVLAIIGGFTIVISAMALVFVPVGRAFDEQVLAAVLGVVGGVLANFVAIIFLRMYSDTISSLTDFHLRLVRTHHLHFGNLLVAKVTDKPVREKALADMAVSLAQVRGPDHDTAPADRSASGDQPRK